MKGITGSNVRYFYNPCYSFSLGPNCSNSAVSLLFNLLASFIAFITNLNMLIEIDMYD